MSRPPLGIPLGLWIVFAGVALVLSTGCSRDPDGSPDVAYASPEVVTWPPRVGQACEVLIRRDALGMAQQHAPSFGAQKFGGFQLTATGTYFKRDEEFIVLKQKEQLLVIPKAVILGIRYSSK